MFGLSKPFMLQLGKMVFMPMESLFSNSWQDKRNMAIHIIDDAKDELKNRSKGRLVCPLKREEEGLKNLGNLDNMMSLLNQGTWDEQRGSTVVTI